MFFQQAGMAEVSVAAADTGTDIRAARTLLLLEGPIVPVLLRLGLPNVAVMVAQAAVGLIETYFVGFLGTDALAGVALVFPVLMLMQMMSAGAIGGGWSLFRLFDAGLAGLFAMVSLGLLVFGGIIAAAIARGSWKPPRS